MKCAGFTIIGMRTLGVMLAGFTVLCTAGCDAVTINDDSGIETDAGSTQPDGGALDAGYTDAGSLDAGFTDGGASLDGGADRDAGADLDAGLQDDAGVQTDAGLQTDAGVLTDAGLQTDAGGQTDAGLQTDAGGQTDAGSGDAGRADAGSGDAGSADGGILNPYYARTSWRLWTTDETPVTYSGTNMDGMSYTNTFGVLDGGSDGGRRFPDITVNTFPRPYTALLPAGSTSSAAGFWDDVAATRDGAHSNMQPNYGDGRGNNLGLSGQFIRLTYGYAQPFDIARIGVNFTSESLSNSGHQLIGSNSSATYTERNFTFVNAVRATPGYLSYAETISDRHIDSYDALWIHSFNSLGRSSSEVTALTKMLIAGGYLPRVTKDRLKLHGAYALTLLSLWRHSLPYVAADGSALPLWSEVLHRPVYYSAGSNSSEEFAPRNKLYHQYDEGLHMYRMLDAARKMTVAPPVAVVQVQSISVEKSGVPLVTNATTDSRIKGTTKTMLRVWGNSGERITLKVSLAGSYDLQGLPLTFEAHGVYPEQKNVTITKESTTLFTLVVTHDPTLPKGRIPVVFYASNGQLPSNPAFVNFYWPETGQVEVPGYVSAASPNPLSEVTRNKRPIFTSSLGAARYVNVLPGMTPTITLSCTDPEGFPTRYYRWMNDPGTLSGSTLSLPVASTDPGSVYPLRLICSDGTGGTESQLLKVVVTPNDGVLPSPWKSTVYGLPSNSGSVSAPSTDTFELTGVGELPTNHDHGRMVFRELPGDTELTAQLLELSVPGVTANTQARAGLMIRESLDTDMRVLFSGAQGNQNSTTPLGRVVTVRTTPGSSPAAVPGLSGAPTYLKVSRRGTRWAASSSADGLIWDQYWTGASGLTTPALVGAAVISPGGVPAKARFKLLPAPTGPAIPMATLSGTTTVSNAYSFKTTADVTLIPEQAADTVRYTLDGSEPTATSTAFVAPITITTAGLTVLKAKTFSGATASQTLRVSLTIVP